MAFGKYGRGAVRLITIFLILARKLLVKLPYRSLILPRPQSRKEIGKYLQTKRPKVRAPVVARDALESLGPAFVKFGQFLGGRPDLIPQDLCAEFRKLRDQAPPFPPAQVRRELAKELKGDVPQLFPEFDEIPVDSAFVAQVHRARLRTGEEVAVKVQRPGIRETMERDVLIMLFFAGLLEKLSPAFRKYQPVLLVKEFSQWIDRELDFRQEGKNALQFAYYAEDDPGVKVPKAYLEHTTDKVLVLEYIRGFSTCESLPASIDKQAMARRVAETLLKEMFVDGFFHGDPHRENIVITEDNAIAYLDFDIVGYLAEDLRAWSFDLLYALARGDCARVIDSFREICIVNEDEVNIDAYRRRMHEVLCERHICERAGIPLTFVLERFVNASLEYGVSAPPDFLMLSRTLGVLERTCLFLDPGFRFAEYVEPFARNYLTPVMQWDEVVNQLKTGPFELGRLRRLAETHGLKALRVLESPTFRIESEEFRDLVNELVRASLNVTYGLIIAALVVFAASLSNESAFEAWLKTALHLPVVPILPVLSMVVALSLWVRIYLRSRLKKARKILENKVHAVPASRTESPS